MKVNAANVEKLARRSEDENYRLRQYLKFQDELSEQEVDQLVGEIAEAVWQQVDCTACGNCCREPGTQVTAADAARLAKRLGASPEDFRRRFLKPMEDEDGDVPAQDQWEMKDLPCPFLKDNRCTVYEDRPEQCREYPYLHRPEFTSRTLGMIERSFTCPAVYQVLQKLREELPYRDVPEDPW